MDFAADFEIDDLPFVAANNSGADMEDSHHSGSEEPEMPMGVIKDMPNEEYQSSPAISKSGLDKLDPETGSPAHLWYYQQEGSRATKAKDFGSLFHDVTLMGIEWAKRFYLVEPEFNKRSNDGKEEYARWLSMLSSNQIAVTPDDWALAMAMRDSVLMHPYARWLIEQAQAENECENSHFWVDDETFNYSRVRPDIKVSSKGLMGDLKSTEDCTPKAFAKSIAEYRYDVQDAMYRDGVKQSEGFDVVDFWFIATEKKREKPVTAIYRLDDDALRRGHEYYRRDMNLYAELMAKDDFVAPSEISMPKWAFK